MVSSCSLNSFSNMKSTRESGEQVVTKLGRRFYEEAPQTEWIINLPMAYVRNGQTFNNRYIDLTP